MVWVLPTFSRPKQCADVLRRIKNSGCTSRGVVFVNGHHEEYRKLVELPDGWEFYFAAYNFGALGALNKVFEKWPDEPWYGFIADDEMLEDGAPRDWDKRLIEAAGDWGASHGMENWHKGGRLQGYVVIGGKLVRELGFIGLPTCKHNYGFDCMYEWLNGAEAFGGGGLRFIKLVPEVEVFHNRAKPDLVLDDCYKLGESTMEEDRRAFWDWCKTDMQDVAKRIRCAR